MCCSMMILCSRRCFPSLAWTILYPALFTDFPPFQRGLPTPLPLLDSACLAHCFEHVGGCLSFLSHALKVSNSFPHTWQVAVSRSRRCSCGPVLSLFFADTPQDVEQ